jgi:para-aminobenzoate synthetase component 1
LEEDYAENTMIVDLVRNDLSRVCATGSVTVADLCAVEKHPGLVHLVSTVRGELRDGAGCANLLAATFPPGFVTGAPKESALNIIRALETAPRGPYCGGVGWVDADRGRGELAVGVGTSGPTRPLPPSALWWRGAAEPPAGGWPGVPLMTTVAAVAAESSVAAGSTSGESATGAGNVGAAGVDGVNKAAGAGGSADSKGSADADGSVGGSRAVSAEQ